jgi:NADPH:quinone reductase-like Zn-dependent oxidoreductase
MKAARINRYGGSEVVEISTDVTVPTPSQGEVLVEVHAAGVNPVDWKIREGYLKQGLHLKIPATLGIDFSGLVHGVGAGVTEFVPGDEVFGQAKFNTGSFAEYALAETGLIARKPEEIGHVEAGALPLPGVSALQALVDHMAIKRGQKILIHGGAGGIGSLAIQIAIHLGASVSTTVGTKDVEYVKSLGVVDVIDYRNQSFETLQHDYDAVFDTVGGETYRKSYGVIRKGGVLVSMLEQPDQKLMLQFGVRAVGQWTRVTTAHLLRLAELAEQGVLRVNIDRIFSLNEATEALVYQREGHPRGKIVIKIR